MAILKVGLRNQGRNSPRDAAANPGIRIGDFLRDMIPSTNDRDQILQIGAPIKVSLAAIMLGGKLGRKKPHRRDYFE